MSSPCADARDDGERGKGTHDGVELLLRLVHSDGQQERVTELSNRLLLGMSRRETTHGGQPATPVYAAA